MSKRLRLALLLASVGLMASLLFVSMASAIHPVPNGASPVRVPIVNAMKQCPFGSGIAGNHGGTLPVTYSCPNPDTVSSTVTAGNSAETFARLGQSRIIVCTASTDPGCSTVGAFPDVRLFGNSSDVVCKAGATAAACPGGAGSDYDPNPAAHPQYTAGLTSGTNSNTTPPTPICGAGNPSCAAGADMTAGAAIPGSTSPAGTAIRITDHLNNTPSTGDPAGCTGSQSCSATVLDAPFPVPVVCAATTTGAIGSYCGVNSTANALVPGVVISGTSSVVQIGQIQIVDSGPDGARSTTDDQLVGVQGILIP
jgi:hypothetical protein